MTSYIKIPCYIKDYGLDFLFFFTLKLLLSQTTDDIDKANLLNDYFRDQTLINENNAFLPILPPFNTSPLRDIIVTPAEVQIILKSLPVDRATGPDEINNVILRELAEVLASPLLNYFKLEHLGRGSIILRIEDYLNFKMQKNHSLSVLQLYNHMH